MAACHLVGRADYPGEAATLARQEPSRWREVFVLAAGHAARTHRLVQAVSAVNTLCPGEVSNVEQPDAEHYRRAQLAGEALLEIGLLGVRREEVGQVVLARVQGWLAAAMRADRGLEAKERVAAGDTLARLGDPRFREDAWFLPDGPLLGFVEIPEGPFVMGSDKEHDPMSYGNEQPQREVDLTTYYIARYPVTVAQFRAFVEESGYEPGDQDSLRDVDNHPVAWVSWHEALKYCEWLTKNLRGWEGTPEPLATLLRERGWAIALPSEAEWEKAARGTDGRIFPWGKDADPERANYDETGVGTTSAVGCFPGGVSPYGVEDLSGNVWEWTRSLWGKSFSEPEFGYPYDFRDGRESPEAGDDVRRVLRGGSFYFHARYVRCACRLRSYPHNRFTNYGFRVVASPVRSDL